MITIQGDLIYWNGFKVAEIIVPTSTIRHSFTESITLDTSEMIDVNILKESLEEHKVKNIETIREIIDELLDNKE